MTCTCRNPFCDRLCKKIRLQDPVGAVPLLCLPNRAARSAADMINALAKAGASAAEFELGLIAINAAAKRRGA